MAHDYDVIIVGSGFGGSVSALRLTEKGYRVAVIEAGRRFADDEFAKTSWNLRKFLWAPQFGCYGVQRLHLLKDVMVLAGAGVGGGSLNYANTLYRPLSPFYADKQWSDITDWESELAPHYDQASRMLGVVTCPLDTPHDEVMRKVAGRMGISETYHPTPVGVYFGESGEDPYFGGAGPERSGCVECGNCMTGCRHNAKNTLTKNYLYLAEQNGAEIIPMTTVTAVREGNDGLEVDVRRTGKRLRRGKRTMTSAKVVLAAGTWGTQQLLHAMRDTGQLPGLSDRLGHLTRTNSEAIIGSTRFAVGEQDFSRGVAITSSIHPTENTHLEPVRYGKGSNAMGLLQTLATEGDGDKSRARQFFGFIARHPVTTARLLHQYRWSERTMILLVMQSMDNSLTTYTKKGRFGRRKYTSKQGHGEPNPTFIRAGYEANQLIAEEIGGTAGSTWSELFNIPMTAHFLGGCAIGASPESGVIDAYHRVYGHPGLSVVDGAAISANLGVNPSLTITAQAERAMSFWPNKGEADPRPEPGSGYRRISPTAPRHPAVPDDAPGALRLPIVEVK